MPQISIIVPIYKTEKYLNRCVDSILNQKFTDFELILVDDGSPDQCPAMCDEYVLKDMRVRVIHKKNAGVAAARNSGLDAAVGEYITFVDSDDWIDPEMYQSMMKIARKYDCDVVMCDCVKDFQEHSEVYSHDIREGLYDYEQLKDEYYPHLLMMENVEYPATISNYLCLYRQNLDKRSCLRYVEGVRFSEDLLFGAQMMYQARSFYYMKGKVYYHYCMNLNSATHTFHADKWDDYLRLYHNAENFFLNDDVITDSNFRLQIDKMLLFFIYNAVGDIRSAKLSKEEKLRNIRSILSAEESKNLFKRMKIGKLPVSWKQKILTVLYKYQIGINYLV